MSKIKPVIQVQDIVVTQQPLSTKEQANALYTLIAVDKDGKEKGKEFTVNTRTYERTFKNNPKFIVKKNPQ